MLVENVDTTPDFCYCACSWCVRFRPDYEEDTVGNDLFPCVQLLWGGTNDPVSTTGGTTIAGSAAISRLIQANGGGSSKIQQALDENQLFGEIFRHPGRFDAAVWFFSDKKYRLWVNQTAAALYERHGDYFHYAKIQTAIENAIMDAESPGDAVLLHGGPRLELDLKKLPNVDTGMPSKQAMRYNPDGPET